MIVDYVDEVHFLDQSGVSWTLFVIDIVLVLTCRLFLACIVLSPNAFRPDGTVMID